MAAEHTVAMGRRIKEQRDKAGLTQAELAALIPGKADGTQVSKWERGLHRPSPDTLEHIAKALKCPVAAFHIDAPKNGTPDLMAALSPSDLGARLAKIDRRLGRIEKHQKSLADLVAELAIAVESLPKRKPGSGHAGAGAG